MSNSIAGTMALTLTLVLMLGSLIDGGNADPLQLQINNPGNGELMAPEFSISYVVYANFKQNPVHISGNASCDTTVLTISHLRAVTDSSTLECTVDATACKYKAVTFYLTASNGLSSDTQQRKVRIQGDDISYTYLAGSSVSIIGCLTLIYLYLKYPVLRRFPSNMVFWRTIVDLVFSCLFIYVNAWETSDGRIEQFCNAGITFITQFCILASLNWYFVMSLNFYYSIDNPFIKPEHRVKYYHVFSWGFAALMAIIATIFAGYRPDLRLCWVRRLPGINYLNWAVCFLWLWAFVIISLGILVWGKRKLDLRTGFEENTSTTRKEALRQTGIYTIVFTIYWSIAAPFWVVVYYEEPSSGVIQDEWLAFFIPVFASLLGVVDSVTWLGIHWEKILKAQRDRRGSLFFGQRSRVDDISAALRREFIARTSEGMCYAARMAHRPDPHPSPGRLHLFGQSASSDGYSPSPKFDYYQPIKDDEDVRLAAKEQVPVPLSGQPEGFDVTNRHLFYAFAPRIFEWLRIHFETRRVHEKLTVRYQRDHPGCSRNTAQAMTVAGVPQKITDEFADSIHCDPEEVKDNFSEGSSGSFFYTTLDDRYMVKTLTKEEFSFLLGLLPEYYQFMKDHPRSLICKFYGMYSILMYGHTEYFVVMGNVLCSPKYPIDEKYDLKGSIVNRYGVPVPPPPLPREIIGWRKKSAVITEVKPLRVPTLKDNDLKKKIKIDLQEARRILEQLSRDTEFLSRHHIMDYSLLLGLHNCEEKRINEKKHCNGLSREQKYARLTTFYRHPNRPHHRPSHIHDDYQPPQIGLHIPSSVAQASSNSTEEKSQTSEMRHDHQKRSAETNIDMSVSIDSSRDAVETKHADNFEAVTLDSGDIDEAEYDPPFISPARVIIGPGIYHMGIVDILQQWDWKKQVEKYFKILLCHCDDYMWISAVDQETYRERFIMKMHDVFGVDHVIEE